MNDCVAFTENTYNIFWKHPCIYRKSIVIYLGVTLFTAMTATTEPLVASCKRIMRTFSIPEETADKLFDNNTATKYFTRNASAWIQHRFAEGNRFKVTKYAVTSAPDDGPGPDLISNGSFESGAEGWTLSTSSVSTDHSVSGNS